MNEARTAIQVVLPAHNEGEAIGETLQEFYDIAHTRDGLDIAFVVSEDGSKDNTVEVIQEKAKTLPIELITGPERKGYSRAVIDGLKLTTAPLVAFIDSDGQCDPADLKRLNDALGDNDMVVGYRNPRKDQWFRLLFSGSFKVVYERLFPVRLKDPSCPYLIIKREALETMLHHGERGQLGMLRQGFWWEFNARLQGQGVKLIQIPVNHRVRASGTTQVYKWKTIPGIATEHLAALWKLRKETRQINSTVSQKPKKQHAFGRSQSIGGSN